MLSWTALYAFTAFRLRAALAHTALVGVVYAIVLALQGSEAASPIVSLALVVGTPLAVGMLIARLLDRTAREAGLGAERVRSLEESESRTTAIVDAAPDAFMTVGEDGTVITWNRAAERLFGRAAAEVIGRPVAELVFTEAEERRQHDVRRRELLDRPEGAEPVRYELELARADGQRIPVEMSVAAARDRDQRLLVVFVRDLSERRQRERARAELAREQTARAEAERMEGIVRGLQVVLDEALAHDRLDEMLAELVPRVCEVLSAEAATILLSNEDGAFEVRGSTAPREGPEPLVIEPEAGISGKVAARGEPLLIQDLEPGAAADPAMRGMGSIVSAPMLARGEVTGVIQAGVAAPRRFTDDDLLLLGLAADRVALAVERVRVFEREHRIAETLQRTLLPDKLPRLPGLEIAARYLPAAAEAEVGGDWYDVIAIDSGRVGLAMGDVAGKGLTAASMVGRVRSAMRAYALEGHGPQGVVERLNQLVWSELEDSQMVTLVYAVFDSGDGRLEWVNAGHLPPLVIGAGGAARFLDAPSSVPLGVMPFPTYEQGTLELEPGAAVLAYTDGLVERPGELIDDGLARLARAAAPELADDPERLCDALVAELVPRGAAGDDVALLVLHSSPLSERIELEIAAEPGELAAMRALLRRWLSQADGGEEETTEILTAIGEAAANAIEHGTHGAERRPLRVAGQLAGGEVEITVSDHGSWRPERGEDGGGRGLVLMQALMDSVEVNAGAEGTSVRMRRRLAAASDQAQA